MMKKHFKIAIQMDPLESINIKADSTYILALEAQKRGYRLFHYLPENLIYENGRVSALGNIFKLYPNKKTFFKKSKTQKIFLDDYDVVLVRQDPPFNMSYITATYLLEMVSDKTLILNDPKSIRDNPEKLSMFNFQNIIPPTLISKNIEQCFNFQQKYKKTIIKPLYGNGGEGISKLEGTNALLKRKILKLISRYKQPIVMQKYLKEIKEGDRRIILIDGEYVGSVARIPKKGSVTANFHTGGSAKKVGLVRNPCCISAGQGALAASGPPLLQRAGLKGPKGERKKGEEATQPHYVGQQQRYGHALREERGRVGGGEGEGKVNSDGGGCGNNGQAAIERRGGEKWGQRELAVCNVPTNGTICGSDIVPQHAEHGGELPGHGGEQGAGLGGGSEGGRRCQGAEGEGARVGRGGPQRLQQHGLAGVVKGKGDGGVAGEAAAGAGERVLGHATAPAVPSGGEGEGALGEACCGHGEGRSAGARVAVNGEAQGQGAQCGGCPGEGSQPPPHAGPHGGQALLHQRIVCQPRGHHVGGIGEQRGEAH